MKFHDIEKIDAHMHYNTKEVTLFEQARQDSFSFISINTDIPFFDSINNQEKIILDLNFNNLSHIATFNMNNWGKPEWLDTAINQIILGINNGAIAIKFWKNIGMDIKDSDNNFVMLNHPSFQPIFEYLIKNNIPVLGHLGEPKNCWLPIDEMTVNTDRSYFKEHPEYHMALLPEYPTYEEQMSARDSVLIKYPDLIFIGAHLASLEWSVDILAEWLDKFPNAAVDMAERICHLQFQAKENWQKVRDFIIKYQDRIMYATDIIYDKTNNSAEIKETIHQIWIRDWEFFTTNNKMTAPQFEGQFNGLELSDDIITKIYRTNALKWYPLLQNKINTSAITK